MRTIPLVLGCVIVLSGISAHDVITTKLTYTRDVSRVIARRCLKCHGSGASIPLTTYDEVRPWAVAIKEQVLARTMPPWGVVKGFGNFKPDLALTEEEVMLTAAWVVGGAPEGDPALLPKRGVRQPEPDNRAVGDAITVQTRARLDQGLKVAGVRTKAEHKVDSARVVARVPDGRIEPIIWLWNFDPKLNRTFLFRQPMDLPGGTVVESSAKVDFALEIEK